MAFDDAPVRPPTPYPKVPPFRPDPDIMGNDEGNQRILEHDRDAARKFLREQDERER